MRIAYLVNDFPSASSPARVNQIEGVIERGYDVSVYATERPPEQDFAETTRELQDHTFYTHIPQSMTGRVLYSLPQIGRLVITDPFQLALLMNPVKFGKDALSLYPVYRAAAISDKQFDIIHAHRGNAARTGAILKEAGVCRFLVSSFHGYGVRQARKNTSRYRHLFETGDLFLGISQHVCDELRDLGVDDERIVRHFTGIDLKKFSFRWQSDVTSIPDPIKIITVGSLKPIKGIEYGIESMGILQERTALNFEYHIVGGESNREKRDELGTRRDQLTTQAEELGVGEHVIFHGHLTREQVIEQLAESHIYMLTSVEEGLATVLLEAQATGLPVVTTAAGGTTDAVGEQARIVPPRDPEGLADAILELCDCPSKWPKIGRTGRDFVRQNYSTAALNDKLVQMYESLEGGHLPE